MGTDCEIITHGHFICLQALCGIELGEAEPRSEPALGLKGLHNKLQCKILILFICHDFAGNILFAPSASPLADKTQLVN